MTTRLRESSLERSHRAAQRIEVHPGLAPSLKEPRVQFRFMVIRRSLMHRLAAPAGPERPARARRSWLLTSAPPGQHFEPDRRMAVRRA